MIKPSALIIAGSDSGAGAGLQADLKTFSAHKIYAATVVTAITAQNTIGVDKVLDVSTKMIEAQMKSLNKALRTQNDKDLVDSIDYILGKAKMMKEILTDKRYD